MTIKQFQEMHCDDPDCQTVQRMEDRFHPADWINIRIGTFGKSPTECHFCPPCGEKLKGVIMGDQTND